MTQKILMIDDDRNICKVTGAYLQRAGFDVEFAYDGEEALQLFHQKKVDVVLLDLMLPKIDGLVVCQKIRKESNVPIIMVTAKGQTVDKIDGLQIGADDYIVKPFDPNELVARIHAILRRTNRIIDENKCVIRLGELEINTSTYSISVNGANIKLPRKEYELLVFLVKYPNRVFTREELIDKIWGWDFVGEDRVIDLYIKRLRSKLLVEKDLSFSIETIWGVGYKLEVATR
ncbi:response regulator transcription factor [Bacillus sp. CGMCC 1.16607]|uniref:response regulator transcription factor n=1 Tax=Bacillus sp. CGMCC 1.16607 TaxID=3351842 RepID=UPI0036367BFA